MSEEVPDDGERGVCGDDREGLCRSYDRRFRGLRSLTGLPGSALLLLAVDGVLNEMEPSWGDRSLLCCMYNILMLLRRLAMRDISGYLLDSTRSMLPQR